MQWAALLVSTAPHGQLRLLHDAVDVAIAVVNESHTPVSKLDVDSLLLLLLRSGVIGMLLLLLQLRSDVIGMLLLLLVRETIHLTLLLPLVKAQADTATRTGPHGHRCSRRRLLTTTSPFRFRRRVIRHQVDDSPSSSYCGCARSYSGCLLMKQYGSMWRYGSVLYCLRLYRWRLQEGHASIR